MSVNLKKLDEENRKKYCDAKENFLITFLETERERERDLFLL